MQVTEPYVKERNGVWYVGASGVQMYGVIAMWQDGYSAEEIQQSFPAVSLAAIYGAILYYLEHRDEMDAFFCQQDELFRQQKVKTEAKNPTLYAEMRERVARFRETQRQRSTSSTRAAS